MESRPLRTARWALGGERDLIRGDLDVSEVPAVWNEKMERYLGVVPQSDATGCLQDVHWSNATFGYVPTYCSEASSLPSATAVMETELGSLEGVIDIRGFDSIETWLHEAAHLHGKRYPTDQLIQRATGAPLSASLFLDHVDETYSKLYDL